ncbi:hypothetical protein [Derxia gummosa]|uniref:Uncharacterized protein n=1 Tax=Derxia gummosa DSM 723 TaxID=1121388 RepID=A0A8B6X607_9BURK|nr:hypothetical protein [Derxia gummosa]
MTGLLVDAGFGTGAGGHAGVRAAAGAVRAVARRGAARCAVALALAAGAVLPAAATVMTHAQLMLPLAPVVNQRDVKLALPEGFDPAKPSWIAVRLLGVSAEPDPKGQVVLETAFELVPTAPSDMRITLSTRDMVRKPGSAGLAERLRAQAGDRDLNDVREDFGPELTDAYLALMEGKGSVFDTTVVRERPPTGRDDTQMLVSLVSASGIQPAYVELTLGQGELPPEMKAAGVTMGVPKEKVGAFLLSLSILVGWLVLRRRRPA